MAAASRLTPREPSRRDVDEAANAALSIFRGIIESDLGPSWRRVAAGLEADLGNHRVVLTKAAAFRLDLFHRWTGALFGSLRERPDGRVRFSVPEKLIRTRREAGADGLFSFLRYLASVKGELELRAQLAARVAEKKQGSPIR